MSKFRLSSHNLNIEKGRHQHPKLPVEKRICNVCDHGSVEDEEHFILHCPFYQEERIHLFVKVLIHDNKVFNGGIKNVLQNLLQSTNNVIIFSVGKFLNKCMKKRAAQIYVN